MSDPRNWVGKKPAFGTHVQLIWLLPDETDLIELGPEVANALAEDAAEGYFPEQRIVRYRRSAA